MSEINNKVAFQRATELVIQQDKTTQFWVGRFVAVQAGLAIAESALYTWNTPDKLIVPVVATLLAILSIILVITITAIIVREYLWQCEYVEMVKRTEGENPLLFKPDCTIKGVTVPEIFKRLRYVLIFVWAIFIALFWFAYAYKCS